MEAIIRKQQNFLKSYQALKNSIVILENQKVIDESLHNVIIAGIIKHFELTYETAWKFLKEYLLLTAGVEVASPRAVIRSCYENQILTENVTQGFLALIDERNLTVHIYDMQTAERICKEIINYFFVFDEVAKLKKFSEK